MSDFLYSAGQQGATGVAGSPGPTGTAGVATLTGDVYGAVPSSVVQKLTGTGSNVIVNAVRLQWVSGITGPTINQVAQTADIAANLFLIQAQNAGATAVTNTTGGNLVLSGGIGASGNAKPGNIMIGSGTSFAYGFGVIGVSNAAVSPTGTVANGGVYCVYSGAMLYVGSNGTKTALGAA